jgi:hypothetical protein
MGCILEKMDDNNIEVPKNKYIISIDKSNIIIDKSKENSMKVHCETNLRIKIPKEKKYKKNNYN